jgi:hypothetical protein
MALPAPETQQRRKYALVAGGLAILAAAAIVAGVLGSREAGRSRSKAEPVKTQSANHDPYTALVQAATIKPVDTIKVVPKPTGSVDVTPASGEMATPEGPMDGEENWDTETYQPPSGGLAGAISDALSGKKNEGSWKALNGANLAAGSSICYPKDGKELTRMVSGKSCTIIVLTKGRSEGPYVIDKIMNVTAPKIVMGTNPLDVPTIDGTKQLRCFEGVWCSLHCTKSS